MKAPLRRLAILAALAFAACEGGGNSGSETTNGLAGTVRDPEGLPVACARVRLLAEGFDPGVAAAPPVAVTGPKGAYAFSDIAPGRYNLELSDSAGGDLALVRDVEVPSTGSARADGALGSPGSLEARVSDFAGRGDTGYLYIPGTGAIAPVGAAALARGSATLDPVPVGRFDSLVLVLLTGGNRRTVVLARDFEVLAESASATDAFQTWAHARAIPIDTKAMGISADVPDFPLLVRLAAPGFDFSQAAPHGEDLRFTDAAGRPLPFQIGRWDPGAGRAEAWVRVDTVRGNDAGQHIVMRWGRSGARGDAPGPAVFAPEAGFATVYHLDEAPNAEAGGYRDATPNGNHATAASVIPGAQVPGIIGAAKAFAGGPASVEGTLTAAMPKGFGGNASFTVSFWLRYQFVPQRQSILDFGTYGLQTDVHFLLRPDTTIQFGAYDMGASGSDPAKWQSVIPLPQPLARWTHVATVYDAAKGSLEVYVDGARADSLAASPMAVDPLGGLRIGRQLPVSTEHPESPFNGALDEIRFENRALPPERIRLDYATQKP